METVELSTENDDCCPAPRGGPLKESGLVLGSLGPGFPAAGKSWPLGGEVPRAAGRGHCSAGDSGPCAGAQASGRGTGSKAPCVRLRRGPSAPWQVPRRASQLQQIVSSPSTMWGCSPGKALGEGGTTHPHSASPHRRPARPPPGSQAALEPAAKVQNGTRPALAKSGRSCCLYIFSFYLKLSQQVKCRGNAIFSRLPRSRGHCTRPQHPASRQRVENLQLLPVQLVELPGQALEGGLVVFHLLLWRQVEEGRAVCGIRARTHSYFMSGPHTLASFRLHTTWGGCFTRRKPCRGD